MVQGDVRSSRTPQPVILASNGTLTPVGELTSQMTSQISNQISYQMASKLTSQKSSQVVVNEKSCKYMSHGLHKYSEMEKAFMRNMKILAQKTNTNVYFATHSNSRQNSENTPKLNKK